MLSAQQLNDEPISESRDKVKSYQYSSALFADSLQQRTADN